MTIQAGKLDRKITLQRKSDTISASGAVTEAWTNLSLRLSASMWPSKASETYSFPERLAFEQVEFRIRYSDLFADLSPKDRIIYPALTIEESIDEDHEIPDRHIYDILGVLEMNRREGIRIISSRRVDVS